MSTIGKDIALAARLLAEGKLVAIPTETVYGLAANGLNANAVLKIYEAKNRPSFNPLILHVADISQAERLTAEFPAPARLLAEKFWPGPLTVVVKKNDVVPPIVTAGLDTMGIRVPRHPLTLELLRKLEFPLAAPSANPSGYVSPTTPQHVAEQLTGKVAYILDGGQCVVGIESTIVKVANNEVAVLRLGGITLEDIETALSGTATVNIRLHAAEVDQQESPGMMASHYAPQKKFLLGNIAENMTHYPGKKFGLLWFAEPGHQRALPPGIISSEFVLSPTGDLQEAARNLFSYLRMLDNSAAEIILAEPVPDEGLGRAINDRLRRAAA